MPSLSLWSASVFTLCVTLVLWGAVPVAATCYMDEFTGYYIEQLNASLPFEAYVFEAQYWGAGQSVTPPSITVNGIATVNDSCASPCAPVVILQVAFDVLDTFIVSINGLVLTTNNTWVPPSPSVQPLYIGTKTTLFGTNTTYWTGFLDANGYAIYNIWYFNWICTSSSNPSTLNSVYFQANITNVCTENFNFNVISQCKPSPVTVSSSSTSAPHQGVVSSSSSTAGRAYSDPRIGGFWGQDVYVEGLPGEVYSLLSDEEVQVNVRFEMVDGAEIQCPQHSSTPCFNHTGTYFGAMAIIMAGGQHLRVEAGAINDGFASVVIDESIVSAVSAPLKRLRRALGFSSTSSTWLVEQLSYRQLRVFAGLYILEVTNMDHYLDVASVRVSCWQCMERAQPEGLLGRTWRADAELPTDDTAVTEYRVPRADLFGCSSKDKACKA